jgi:type II secretory pathway pseudopilin PulG
MRSGQKSGYTIVETLIFIAVSSGLFFAAMNAVGGRQQQVQFTQAVRNFDSQLKDIMNDVSTGFFPSQGNVSCSIALNAPAATRPVVGPRTGDEVTEQGTSDSCIFAGKALQFGPTSAEDTVDNNLIVVHTLVGRRNNPEGDDVSSIAEANPMVVAPTSETSTIPDFSSQVLLDWGLRVNRVVVPTSSGAQDYGTLGIFNTFSDTQSSAPIAENQVVDLVPITDSAIGDSSYTAVALLNSITDETAIGSEVVVEPNPAEGVVLCLSDPDRNQKAMITLSSANRRLSTSVVFDQVDEALCG